MFYVFLTAFEVFNMGNQGFLGKILGEIVQFSIFKSVIFIRHVCTVCESTSLYSFLVMLYTTRLLKSNKKSVCVCENYKPIMQNDNK